MVTRALLAAVLILGAGVYVDSSMRPGQAPAREPLAMLPMTLDGWEGHEAPPLPDDVIAQLGVDDYVNRRYVASGALPVSVYVGYYASQTQGDTVHSPRNCLPGAGWQPVSADRAQIVAGGAQVPVNRFVIQKGTDRQAVFYWYQGRGRFVASDFANKGWLMLDAARLGRTDGGLVRLITPMDGAPQSAFSRLAAFAATLIPHLTAGVP